MSLTWSWAETAGAGLDCASSGCLTSSLHGCGSGVVASPVTGDCGDQCCWATLEAAKAGCGPWAECAAFHGPVYNADWEAPPAGKFYARGYGFGGPNVRFFFQQSGSIAYIKQSSPGSSYQLLKGCSGNNAALASFYGQPRMELETAAAGMVVCCTRRGASDRGSCYSGQGTNSATMKTHVAAAAICVAAGKRLCASQSELDASCGTGCEYDNSLVWTSATSMSTRTALSPPPLPPFAPLSDGESVASVPSTVVSIGLTLAGDVSSFESTQASLADSLRQKLLCHEPDCHLKLRILGAGSVVVEAVLIIPDAPPGGRASTANATAVEVEDAAAQLLSLPLDAISSSLGVSVASTAPMQVAVHVLTTIVVAPPPPPSASSRASGLPTAVTVLFAVLGAFLLIFAGVFCYRAYAPQLANRHAKPKPMINQLRTNAHNFDGGDGIMRRDDALVSPNTALVTHKSPSYQSVVI